MTNSQATPLGEILSRSIEIAEIQPDESYKEITVKLWGKGAVLRGITTGAELNGSRRFLARKGQLILSRIDARNGAIGIVPESLDGSVVSNDFPLFALNKNRILPGFFEWLSKTKPFVELCQKASEGTTNRVRLQEDRFLNLQIPLPPLPEQWRIVARIEELAAKINDVRGLRQKAAEETEAMVRATRNRYVLELQKGYPEVQLGDVCRKITDGPHVSPQYVEQGIPFISVRNISDGGLDFASAKFITETDHAEFSKKAAVEFGDVRYTKGGTTGVARRVDTRQPFSIWVHVALLKLKQDISDAGFVEHMLNSPFCKQQAEFFTHGSSNRDLGLTRMAKILFPLPLLVEQRRIVAELGALQAKLEALKKLQVETGAELGALLPSLLDKAFREEL